MWLKIPWPKCMERRFPISHVWDRVEKFQDHFFEGWRDFRACLNAEVCTTGPLVVGEGGSCKISVPYVGGTRLQCPGIEVELRFQDPCVWGGGEELGDSWTNI